MICFSTTKRKSICGHSGCSWFNLHSHGGGCFRMIAVRLQDSGLASQDQPYRVIVKWKYKSLITCSFSYVWRLITSFPASGYPLDLPPPLLRMLDAPCFSPRPSGSQHQHHTHTHHSSSLTSTTAMLTVLRALLAGSSQHLDTAEALYGAPWNAVRKRAVYIIHNRTYTYETQYKVQKKIKQTPFI